MNHPPMGYGLIGAGSFGQFCVRQYQQMEEVRPLAVADANAQAAQSAASSLGIEACDSVDAMLARDDIEIVHIATPPATHHDIALKALEKGKHVLCEKPLATSLEDARRVIDAARDRKRVLAVDLIMRYNPLCAAVERVLREKLLGEPLHGFFENYAKDEPLGPTHWFWNKKISGGIFIEHAVHFFDLFQWWLGKGQVVAAQQVVRPGTKNLVEQVVCTVRHEDQTSPFARGLAHERREGEVLVHHYHGFTQAARMDRQEMRILCERGSITLYDWVPTHARFDLLADQATLCRLHDILPSVEIESKQLYDADDRQITSRHKDYRAEGRYHLIANPGMSKDDLYGHVVRSLMADQIAAARDPKHRRRVTEDNGYTSLQPAVAAEALATQNAR